MTKACLLQLYRTSITIHRLQETGTALIKRTSEDFCIYVLRIRHMYVYAAARELMQKSGAAAGLDGQYGVFILEQEQVGEKRYWIGNYEASDSTAFAGSFFQISTSLPPRITPTRIVDSKL